MERLYNVQVWLPDGYDVSKVYANKSENETNYLIRIENVYPVVSEEKSQMTRQQAIEIVKRIYGGGNNFVLTLEALGLLKFEEEEKIKVWFETESSFGKVRIEEWPEGLVLWVGGEIKWRSWK